MKILVTGACGYKGSVLVPKLIQAGHDVLALDIMWFGNQLDSNPKLSVIEADVRDVSAIPLRGVDAIVHLSSIANDPCGDLNPELTWEVSCLATMQLADKAAREGIRHFIYASSGSVYGLKSEPAVTENLELVPLSAYNKTKMVAERALLSYRDDMAVQIVRPATVCGLSPRMRLDVAVNLLTMQALRSAEITVLGGEQIRPNIHIDDITDLYLFLLEKPEQTGVFNAGFENLSIAEIANKVAKVTGAKVSVKASNDPRSYRVNSDKILAAGFRPKKSVDVAISEIVNAYGAGDLTDDERHYNLRWMQSTVFSHSEAL